MLNWVGATFLVLFLAALVGETVLSLLNMRHMKEGGSSLPPDFKPFVDDQVFRRSVAYNLESQRLGLASGSANAVLVLILIYFGGFEFLDVAARSFVPDCLYGRGLAVAGSVVLLKYLLNLPFTVYDTFWLEQRYGFNRTTPRLFVSDTLKGLALLTVLGAPLLLGVLWFMESAGSRWWVWAWTFLLIFQVLMIFIYPTWIAPLFNTFTPLEEGPLKESIRDLARRVGFPFKDILIMDGSRRSTHSNAYFTGLGPRKRIVLFDTLVNGLSIPRMAGVLAHEMGHFKLRHVIKALFLNAVVSLAGFWVLSLLLEYEPFYRGLGFSRPSPYAALILFSICASTISFFFQPLLSSLSRHHEYRADRFAVDSTGDRQSMAEAIILLARENLSNLNPHPWYSYVYYSHPAPVERVRAILNLPRPDPGPC